MQQLKNKDLRYYEGSDRATLFSFRGVVETSDIRFLLILDDYDTLPDIDEQLRAKLSEAWFNIYTDFSKKIEDSGASLRFAEEKRLTAKRFKIEYLSTIVTFLASYPEKVVADTIRDELNINTEAKDYEAEIKKAVAQIQKMKLHLKRSETKDEGNENNLDDLITEAERFQGYQFDEKKMTVNKFASIIKKYKHAGTSK